MQKEVYGMIIASIVVSFTIGWLWGLEKIGKDVYNMIEIIVSIGLVVVTGLMFYSISKQVKYSGDILGKEMKQLNIDQGNFDMKTKLITLEFMNLFEKREAYKNYNEIIYMIRYMDYDKNKIDIFTKNKNYMNAIPYILNNYEWLSVRCLLLEKYLSLDIIDEIYGLEMYEVLENSVVKNMKDVYQQKHMDIYSNLDAFYPKIKKIRKRKMNSSQ